MELKYAQSTHLVDIIAKDEDMRRLRFDIHILEDDNNELRDLLTQEEDRSNNFEVLVNENLARAEEAEARLQDAETMLRVREQEVGTLQAEAKALKTTVQDSETFLTEKLALTRELSVLRPELEHLKAQAASAEALMTEKLELQRQVSNMQCEVENVKRDLKRAQAKRRNTGVEIAQEEQVDDLKRQLAKEKRARQRAEQAAETTQNDSSVDDVRKELAREKRARQKAEEELEAALENTQVEGVRKDLLREKKAKQKLEETVESLREELGRERKVAARAAKRADATAETDEQLEELRHEFLAEKKERTKSEKAMQKAAEDFEAQKQLLDEKLGQFRTKLRSTKEKLKETEAELEAAREEAAESRKGAKASVPAEKNTKKRSAAAFDADATTLGTPGDGQAAKRGRKAGAGIGEKSSFSMTPFLNKTASILPDSPADADDGERDEEEVDVPTPTLEPAKSKKQPLAPKPANDGNIRRKHAGRPRKQKATLPALEMVMEEAEDAHSQGQENAPAAKSATKVRTKTTDGSDEQSGDVEKRKKRKSLVDFASFNPEPEVKKREKKSRKLGGTGKTLFDEEEESAVPAKALPGKMFLGGRGFGALGAGQKKASGFLGASKIGSSILMTAGDGSGFTFSPLKRRRGNLDDTLRG
ncbi:hypothetical protein DOTSEDRAFT_81413 [Dothistroma septosporum NZE10]|uniref:Uncharacterized protein n=1 Tax=Dothistroma septosporum (strain NZE10 / CBS 128990) TaxID=675120 RepID=N1PM06_DOTSN|nr:hypothetical protein DOTSEDRAFT_81413 [Dothistroma septosporum NZE10]